MRLNIKKPAYMENHNFRSLVESTLATSKLSDLEHYLLIKESGEVDLFMFHGNKKIVLTPEEELTINKHLFPLKVQLWNNV